MFYLHDGRASSLRRQPTDVGTGTHVERPRLSDSFDDLDEDVGGASALCPVRVQMRDCAKRARIQGEEQNTTFACPSDNGRRIG